MLPLYTFVILDVNKSKNSTSIHSLKLLKPNDAKEISKLCQDYMDVFEYKNQ